MTWISGTVVGRQDKDELCEIVVAAFGNRYRLTIPTADADKEGYHVGVAASVDVREDGTTVAAIVRCPE